MGKCGWSEKSAEQWSPSTPPPPHGRGDRWRHVIARRPRGFCRSNQPGSAAALAPHLLLRPFGHEAQIAKSKQRVDRVVRNVASALYNGLRGRRKVEREPPPRFSLAEQDVHDRLVPGPELNQQGGRGGGDLRYHSRAVQKEHDYRRDLLAVQRSGRAARPGTPASRRGRTTRTRPDEVVRGIEPQHRQVGVSGVVDYVAQPGCGCRADVLDVDRLIGAKWQCCWARVRGDEPHHRGTLCGLALSHEVSATDGGHRAVDVEEGLVEQAEDKLLAQQPAH